MTPRAGEPDVLRVGVLGCGAIGRVVAAGLAAGDVPGACLAGVVTRSPVTGLPARRLPELLAECDLIVETAGQQAVRDHGTAVLAAGVDLLVVSVGALADPTLAEALNAAGPGRIFYTSGAIGGLDLLAAARRQGPFGHVRLTSTKKPATLAQPWMDAGMLQRLETATEPFDVYRGTAREVPAKFPKSTNVAACVALATRTWEAEIVVRADPAATMTQHTIEAEGAYGRYRFDICNVPDRSNPATSMVVPYAVLRSVATLARAGGQIL